MINYKAKKLILRLDNAMLGDIRLEKLKEELKVAKQQIEHEIAHRKQAEQKVETMILSVVAAPPVLASQKNTTTTDGKSSIQNTPVTLKNDPLEKSEFKELIRSILDPKKTTGIMNCELHSNPIYFQLLLILLRLEKVFIAHSKIGEVNM